MSDNFEVLDDRQLIARFCAGDKQAGDVLFARHQQKLLVAIERLLQKQGYKSELPQDVAQQVWLALIRDDFRRLKHYDETLSRFDTYFELIAKQLIQQRRRSKGGTTKREFPLQGHEPIDPAGNEGLVQAELAEYLDHLTPRESRFLREKLMRQDEPANQTPISRSNEYTLKHRLQQKLPDHIDMP